MNFFTQLLASFSSLLKDPILGSEATKDLLDSPVQRKKQVPRSAQDDTSSGGYSFRACLLVAGLLLAPAAAPAQAGQADAGTSDPKAVALLAQMIAALGGPKWLAVTDVVEEGRTSGFYQGKPTGAIGDFSLLRTVPVSRAEPGRQRTEFTKKRDVVSFLLANPDREWEVTYKGKRLLPPEEYLTVFRRRDHSLDEAVRVWRNEPGTVLFYGGQKMQERHLVEELTMLDSNNDNITIQVDSDTHLPYRVSFTWRDPLYKDNNEDAEEFADYHPVNGLPTALNQSFYHNGDMTSQRYLSRVLYNVPVAPDAFDVDAATARIKR